MMIGHWQSLIQQTQCQQLLIRGKPLPIFLIALHGNEGDLAGSHIYTGSVLLACRYVDIRRIALPAACNRSEERRVGKSLDIGGVGQKRTIILGKTHAILFIITSSNGIHGGSPSFHFYLL